MKILLPVLDGIAPPAGAPVLSAADLSPVYPQPIFEPGALEHWLFGDSDESLNGMKGVSGLVPMNLEPTFEDSYVSLGRGALNGLVSTIAEPDEYTLCIAFHYQPNSDLQRVLFGTAQAGGGDGKGLLAAQNLTDSVQGLYRPNGNVTLMTSTGLAPKGGWRFLALGMDAEGNVWRSWAGSGATFGGTPATEYAKSTRALAFGNAYYSASTHLEGLDLAEGIIFPGMLSNDDLADVYARSVDRLADRGIALS